MNMTRRYLSAAVLPVLLGVVLAGCSGDDGYQDLDEFMSEARDAPRGEVEPLPEFQAYEAFEYSAADRRAPFSPPEDVELEREEEEDEAQPEVQPDENRPTEPLERFSISDLTMVGSLQREEEGVLYALVNDNQGGVHRVTVGNYMGENHGRVERVTDSEIRLTEIISDGRGGWVERPRTVSLEED